MKLSELERYEIVAETFRRVTGYMAPGKDIAPGAHDPGPELRLAVWQMWVKEHRAILDATLNAMCAVMPHDEPETATEVHARKG